MPLDFERISVLCFDLDGTISDTDDLYVQTLQRWLAPFRMVFPGLHREAFSRRIVMAMETPGNYFLQTLDRLRLDNLYYRLRNRSRSKRTDGGTDFQLIPGVKEILLKLKDFYPMAVVSSREASSAQEILESFGLVECFQLVVAAESTIHTKPHPDPLLLVAEQQQVLPTELLMIGDTVVDILAAKAAGAQTIGVLCGFGSRLELERAGADLILDSTAHIPVELFPKFR
jgi:HAD superfamily hydrolase (TIGR01549 family)